MFDEGNEAEGERSVDDSVFVDVVSERLRSVDEIKEDELSRAELLE